MDLCDRQKRDVHYSDHLTEEDFQLLKQTPQPRPRFRRELPVTPVSKENATRYCAERIFETKIGKLCAKVGVNVQALVNTCSADVEVSKLLLLSKTVFTCFTSFSHLCLLTLKPARFLFLSLPWWWFEINRNIAFIQVNRHYSGVYHHDVIFTLIDIHSSLFKLSAGPGQMYNITKRKEYVD